ncbi:MAG: tubulin-like doman-containing protein [Tannerella sp.]|jgi:hypothetical protein|nr:tubulin-like doman-containing protein [Tannerella sp.]
MAEEKHIFIGIGGSGVNTVTKVKYKIYEKLTATAHKSRLELLNGKYRFLFVDTDAKDIKSNNEEYRNRYEHGKVDFIDPGNELVNLGDQNPKAIYREARKEPRFQLNRRILEACDDRIAAMIPDSTLEHGAGAFRMKSRIAFARKSTEFNEKLGACILELNSLSEGSSQDNTIYYWVAGSSNGGTGSGILNDVLYYVNMMHRKLVVTADPKVVLLLYMPQYYIDRNPTNERYPKNAYATLSELEAFQCLSLSKDPVPVNYHRLALIRDYHQFNTNITYRPFNYCIPVDYQTDKGANMGSLANMYCNTAEMLYYIHSGAGGEGFRSASDNFINEIQGHSPKSFLIPMGYIALRKPEKDFEDYLQIRMRYELVKYGLIGEPIQSDTERNAVRTVLYNNVIKKYLFGADAESLRTLYRKIVNDKLEDELQDNLIMDSGNNLVPELPAGLSVPEIKRFAEDIERAIRRKQEEQETCLNRIEAELWKWVEENSIKHGLEYVNIALAELDGYCTDRYDAFTVDRKGADAQRKALQNNIDAIDEDLNDLYRKAVTVTFSERIGKKNREDVNRYFQRLKDYVGAKTDLYIDEQTYDLLGQLCAGDSGIIDRIKGFVSNLLAEAYHALTGEKGAQAAYDKLARSFLEKSHDVTSVYLPQIQEFVDGYGWKEGHKFSEWYSLIIRHTDRYERGKGFVPVRSGNEKSLEGLIGAMIKHNRKQLVEKGYLDGEKSQLFSNPKIENPRKNMEDILYYASLFMEEHSRTALNDEWFSKPLSDFYDELDLEKRKEIKGRLDPSLFLSYNQSRENHLSETKRIYVAKSESLAKEILGYNANGMSEFNAGSDASTLYLIKVKIGLSFDFYRNYDVIKPVYENTAEKGEYHFHLSFANCNGDYGHIFLPKELEPELVSFARYMLVDGFKHVLSSCYHSSSNAFDRDNYTNTPFVLEEKRALIATKRNVSRQGENVCLTVRDGETVRYSALTFGNTETPYIIMFGKFKELYISESLADTIHKLIATLKEKSGGSMEEHYDDVRLELIRKLDGLIPDIKSREERKTVSDILEALTKELDTFEKFTN